MITTSSTLTQKELLQAGGEALRRELGVEGMIRFLQLFMKPSGDYTAERAELLGDPTVAEIVEAFERRKAEEQDTST